MKFTSIKIFANSYTILKTTFDIFHKDTTEFLETKEKKNTFLCCFPPKYESVLVQFWYVEFLP